jgi:hypothetical protein
MGYGAGQSGNVPDRFRSFAERYIIARAAEFTKGKELEDGWQAIQDAKKLYQMTAQVQDAEQHQQSLQAQEQVKQQIQAIQAAQMKVAPPIPYGDMLLDPEILATSQRIAEKISGAKVASPTLIRKLYKAMKGKIP